MNNIVITYCAMPTAIRQKTARSRARTFIMSVGVSISFLQNYYNPFELFEYWYLNNLWQDGHRVFFTLYHLSWYMYLKVPFSKNRKIRLNF